MSGRRINWGAWAIAAGIALITMLVLTLRDGSGAEPAQAPEAQLLYVQRAERGTLTTLDAAAGTYRLTLRGAEPSVEWFTDRPEHRAGRVGVHSMLRTFGWEASGDGLGDDPPNLVLSADGQTGDASELVAELRSARWDAARRVAVYELRRNPGSAAPRGEIALDRPSLFIDSAAVVAPVTFYRPLAEGDSGDLTVETVVEGFPEAGAHVSFMLYSEEVASYHLTPQAPTATGGDFTVESFGLRVNSLRLQPATADSPGRVYADLTLSPENGRGPMGTMAFNSVIAQWTTPPATSP